MIVASVVMYTRLYKQEKYYMDTDAYYNDNDGQDEELDLSFLDEDKKE